MYSVYTNTTHLPHTGPCPAHAPVWSQCVAFPARSPLLPATGRSLRAASVFPSSTLHNAEWLRSRRYGSATRVNRQQEDQSGNALGEPGTAPGPENHGPGSRFSQTPLPASPQHNNPAAPMAEETANRNPALRIVATGSNVAERARLANSYPGLLFYPGMPRISENFFAGPITIKVQSTRIS